MKTPYRSLERAYRAGKRIRYIKKDFLSYENMTLFSSRGSWQAITLYTNTELRNTLFIIYWSLSEYRISSCFLNLLKNLEFINLKKLLPVTCFDQTRNPHPPSSHVTKQLHISSKVYFDKLHFYLSKNIYLSFFLHNPLRKLVKESMEESKRYRFGGGDKEEFQGETYSVSNQSFGRDSDSMKQMNKKLAWIKATLNDLNTWRSHYPSFHPLSRMENTSQHESLFKLINFEITTLPHEFTGFVPRSISRTLSRFQTELMGQSDSSLLREFRLAKYQASASIQYIGCLIFFPWITSFSPKEWLLEPWIKNWWDTHQSQIFLNSFQEKGALDGPQKVEEPLWLDELVSNFPGNKSQDLNLEIYEETIRLIRMYNENSIQTILHLLTGIICFTTLGASLISGKKRLSISNSWIQESFYSLSDTMKAPVIPSSTDSRIGSHLPHGWEIVIGSSLEYLGFARNKHIISCFVSTFPVILDTVPKYRILRHLNRISPSIVATYHTMNE